MTTSSFQSRSSGFANFLEHMMQANMSDKLLHHRINKIDLLARYRKACSQTRVATHMETVYMNSFAAKSLEEVYDLDTSDGTIGGIAFMVAYLLVLVIRVSLLLFSFHHAKPIVSFLTSVAHIIISWTRLQPLRPIFSKHILLQVLFMECTRNLYQSWLVFPLQ